MERNVKLNNTTMKHIYLLVILLIACNREDPFTILGTWVGLDWRCTNTQDCTPKYIEKDATITFDITENNNGVLIIESVERYSPTCEAMPGCTYGEMIVQKATYTDNTLFIKWESFEYTGTMKDGQFIGDLYYVSGPFNYLWNYDVVIKKQ
jgi:hypothetical protein